MSDQYEPSYYEIALTGRQVLVAFVVLLVCLVAAFFSGVWVGRDGDEGGAGDEPPVEIAREETGEAGDEPLEELSFFDEEPMERPRDLGEVAREPRADTTLAEDVGGRAPEPEAQPEPQPQPPPPSPAPAPAEPAPQPRPARPEANPSGSLASGDVVIQVFSSSEEAKAREVLARLEENGFRAFLSPVADGDRTLYRVRVGPFEHRSDAEAMAERLRSSMNLETWITQ